MNEQGTNTAARKMVYIAGKITGDPDYRAKFGYAADMLEKNAPVIAVSPAILPDGFSYEAYMRISAAMLKECDMVCMLNDWRESDGAMQEFGRAVAMDKVLIYFDDFRANEGREKVGCEQTRHEESVSFRPAGAGA